MRSRRATPVRKANDGRRTPWSEEVNRSEVVAIVALGALCVAGDVSTWDAERRSSSVYTQLQDQLPDHEEARGTPVTGARPSAPPERAVCRPELDPRRLARLAKNPIAESPAYRNDLGDDYQTYVYQAQGCTELALNRSRRNPRIWSFTCDTTCSRPDLPDLGPQEHLVDSSFTIGGDVTSTKWYLLRSGPLKGNIVSLTETGSEPGVEVAVDSPASIQQFRENFIFDWLCKSRSDIPGFDRRTCGVD
jgi:hypothetical protein